MNINLGLCGRGATHEARDLLQIYVPLGRPGAELAAAEVKFKRASRVIGSPFLWNKTRPGSRYRARVCACCFDFRQKFLPPPILSGVEARYSTNPRHGERRTIAVAAVSGRASTSN